MEPLHRHSHGALQFSGGKDSLALVYLLRPYWDRLTIYHLDTGDLLPEVQEIVEMVERMVPNFQRVKTNTKAWMADVAMPSDLVPTSSTPAGLMIGMSKQRIIDRFDCCALNIMLPMHQRMVADRITLAIRGTKRVDMNKLPAQTGDRNAGYELWLPIVDWTHERVFDYLREVGAPICRVYEHRVNAPECATCPAWWSEGRAEYLAKHHPGLFKEYRTNLQTVAAELEPHLIALHRELE